MLSEAYRGRYDLRSGLGFFNRASLNLGGDLLAHGSDIDRRRLLNRAKDSHWNRFLLRLLNCAVDRRWNGQLLSLFNRAVGSDCRVLSNRFRDVDFEVLSARSIGGSSPKHTWCPSGSLNLRGCLFDSRLTDN